VSKSPTWQLSGLRLERGDDPQRNLAELCGRVAVQCSADPAALHDIFCENRRPTEEETAHA